MSSLMENFTPFVWGMAFGMLLQTVLLKQKPKLTRGKIITMAVIVVLTVIQIVFHRQIVKLLFGMEI